MLVSAQTDTLVLRKNAPLVTIKRDSTTVLNAIGEKVDSVHQD